jgi:hypothetical protein
MPLILIQKEKAVLKVPKNVENLFKSSGKKCMIFLAYKH